MEIIPTATPNDRQSVQTLCKDYHCLIECAWTAPGLTSTFIPQGVCWLPGNNTIAIALHEQHYASPSKLVIQKVGTGDITRSFSLWDDMGNEYRGHAGGVAVCSGSLWVCSGYRVLQFALSDLEQKSGDLCAVGSFYADSKCSFMCSTNEYLWLGEFRYLKYGYKIRKRPVDNAWIAGYRIDPDTNVPSNIQYKVKGVDTYAPDRVIFIPDRVQGMALCNEHILLSVSFGSKNSLLEVFRNPLLEEPFEIELPEGSCPGYALNEQISALQMPAGSQDLDWNGSQLLTVFEGGAEKYRERWRKKGGLIDDRVVVLELPKNLKQVFL
ncbi:MAG: hypothetical protein HQK83_04610 [Fibrobacteria bacterium]|nr:hypothetical protein [Fibrobacteria bacterium]